MASITSWHQSRCGSILVRTVSLAKESIVEWLIVTSFYDVIYWEDKLWFWYVASFILWINQLQMYFLVWCCYSGRWFFFSVPVCKSQTIHYIIPDGLLLWSLHEYSDRWVPDLPLLCVSTKFYKMLYKCLIYKVCIYSRY